MQLPCPKCGEELANIRVDLSTGADFVCCECDGEFTRAELEVLVSKWRIAFAWLDAMPTQAQVDGGPQAYPRPRFDPNEAALVDANGVPL